MIVFFFFQAEDGIRDTSVTGVQTCALPISGRLRAGSPVLNVTTGEPARRRPEYTRKNVSLPTPCGSIWILKEIGRASCRERVRGALGAGIRKMMRVHTHDTDTFRTLMITPG